MEHLVRRRMIRLASSVRSRDIEWKQNESACELIYSVVPLSPHLSSAPGDAGEKGDKGDKGEDGVGVKGSPGAPGAPGEATSCFVGPGEVCRFYRRHCQLVNVK